MSLPPSLKLRIPRPASAPGADIVGLLQKARPSSPPGLIALIIHGVLAHKDQSFHKTLASDLALRNLGDGVGAGGGGMDSFRYDLQGQGGESEGLWTMGGHDLDADDLEVVIAYLERMGYRIALIIAHSRGSIFSSYFLSTRPHAPIPLFISISARYKMDNLDAQRIAVYSRDFAEKGYSEWKVRVAGQSLVRRVTQEGVNDFCQFDNSYLQTRFPEETHVLIIHGDADPLVPVLDSYTYHSIFTVRAASSTHVVIPGKDHNWGSKPFIHPCSSVLSWLADDKRVQVLRDLKGESRLERL